MQRSALVAVVAVASIIIFAVGFTLDSGIVSQITTAQTVTMQPATTSITSSSQVVPSGCLTCVVISTIYLDVVSSGMDSECWNQGAMVLTQDYGPAADANSSFSYTFYFTDNNANNMQDGGYCDMTATVLSLTLSPQSLPIQITSVSPQLPTSVNAGSQTGFTINLATSGGYDGPLTIIMTMQ